MNAKMKAGHHVYKEGTEIIVYEEAKNMPQYWETDYGILHKRFVEVTDDVSHYREAQQSLFDWR